MGKLYFLFGIHNHQPVGNDPYVFREAFDKCYKPFLDVLEEFPKVKLTMHFSGPLFDWLMENEKEFIGRLKRMADKDQIEMIGGGYYEPILQTISDKDKFSQIALMNDFIKDKFGKKPEGMWLAERIWEPYLARIINESGLRYTFLDDTHFRKAGLDEKEFLGHYATEDSSRPIAVFPISKTLRYKIPFSRPTEAIAILKKFSGKKEDILITLFDDGEKFGLWPTTYYWVYEKNWLRDFFRLLVKNEKYIETITASEALKKFPSNGLVYIPNSAYVEMDEWVMEPRDFFRYKELKDYLKDRPDYDEIRYFINSGFFRNFFLKYPRLNYMHKRMLGLSDKLNENASPEKDKDIFQSLWKSQCNCGYWHGVFGGFYFGNIRSSIYENLIEAEKKYDERYEKKSLIIKRADIDLDGTSETMVKNGKMIACFSDKGATMTELSLKEKNFNIINTITRREETYHKKIRGRARRDIVYDKCERLCFSDHLVAKKIVLNDYLKQRKLKTLSNDAYISSPDEKEDPAVLNYAFESKDLDFSKKIMIGSGSDVEARYDFGVSSLLRKYNFAVEFNFFIQSAKDAMVRFEDKSFNVDEKISVKSINSLKIEDRFKGITTAIEFDRADVFIVPVYSITNSIDSESQSIGKMFQEISVLVIKRSKDKGFKIRLSVDYI